MDCANEVEDSSFKCQTWPLSIGLLAHLEVVLQFVQAIATFQGAAVPG